MKNPDKIVPIRLSFIKAAAEQLKNEDFYDDYLSRGTIQGNFLLVTLSQREAIKLKYAPRGLGDRVARGAKPIARALKKITGGHIDLTDCGGCHGPGGRQDWLNDAFPAKPTK